MVVSNIISEECYSVCSRFHFSARGFSPYPILCLPLLCNKRSCFFGLYESVEQIEHQYLLLAQSPKTSGARLLSCVRPQAIGWRQWLRRSLPGPGARNARRWAVQVYGSISESEESSAGDVDASNRQTSRTATLAKYFFLAGKKVHW